METSAHAVTFELSRDDYRAMIRHVCRAPASERVAWLACIFAVNFGAVLVGQQALGFLVGLTVSFALMFARGLLVQRRLLPRAGGTILCRYEMRLGYDGVRTQTPHLQSHYAWPGVIAVEETAAHCFLRTDTAAAWTIPKRAFYDGEAARQFVDYARDCVSRAHAAPNSLGGWNIDR
jgi:hypothetical protein